nr:hypothetical protein [Tanacetum cinerariifolium]
MLFHEKGISKKAETPAVLVIREGKIQKDKKKPQGAKGKARGKNKLAYAPKTKIPPPPKRDNPAKDSICRHRKEACHLPPLERDCGTHICNTFQGLRRSRKLKHGALNMYIGNGMRAAVEAIKSFNLILPSSLIIVLDNCHYAPYVTRGVVLISRLVKNGYIHTFTNYGISISKDNVIYFNAIPHDFSRYDFVYLMRHKHEVFETFKVFQNEVENQLGKKIKAIRSDRGGEYLSHEVSERRNQTLLDMVRSMMNLTALPKSFWGYALETAAHILNMVPTKKVDRTPYKIWHRKALNLSYLRVWGCEALVKRDIPDKLDSKSIKCIFVGYPMETIVYYFYYPLKNKIFVSRNPEFFENSFMVQEASGSHGLLEEHDEVTPIDVEPRSVGVPIRILARIPQALDIYGYYVDVKEYELGDFDGPPNYIAALADLESDKWLEAMNKEMQSIKDNQNKRFGKEIKKIGFTQNLDKPCVYLKASGSNVAFLVLYVDDILLMGNSLAMLQEVKSWLCKCFSRKDLGEAAYILGIKIIRDKSKRLIALSQSAYLEKILKKFRMKNSKKGYTLMMEKPDYKKSQGAKTPTDVQRMAKQSTIAMSSTEAVYITAAEASMSSLDEEIYYWN